MRNTEQLDVTSDFEPMPYEQMVSVLICVQFVWVSHMMLHWRLLRNG